MPRKVIKYNQIPVPAQPQPQPSLLSPYLYDITKVRVKKR